MNKKITIYTKPIQSITSQQGMMLIEAIVGILIFSIGIVSILGLQAFSIKNSSSARSRVEASYFANQIIGQMWADDRNNLASYSHRPNGTGCQFSGAASGYANVTNWLNNVRAPTTGLPGTSSATDGRTQIIVNGQQVTVTICWKTLQDASWHSYTASASINNS